MTERSFFLRAKNGLVLCSQCLRPGALSLILAALVSLSLIRQASAGLIGPSLPKGEEIDDPHIAQLFAPDFPYESIKVIETREGKRYVVVKAKQTIADKEQVRYAQATLPDRNIIMHREGSHYSGTLLLAEIIMYRFPSEKPYVVEYCPVQGEPVSDRPWAPVENVLRFDGKYIIILVNKDFGRVFKTLVLYPEEDIGCPDPPFVGKYPKSRNLGCFIHKDTISFVYVTPDSKNDVFKYYKPLLRSHYDAVGFCYQEDRWGPYATFGILLSHVRFPMLVQFLEHWGGNRLRSKIVPSDAMILEIKIENVISAPQMREHCVITIVYCTDVERIARIKEPMRRYCKGVPQ